MRTCFKPQVIRRVISVNGIWARKSIVQALITFEPFMARANISELYLTMKMGTQWMQSHLTNVQHNQSLLI